MNAIRKKYNIEEAKVATSGGKSKNEEGERRKGQYTKESRKG